MKVLYYEGGQELKGEGEGRGVARRITRVRDQKVLTLFTVFAVVALHTNAVVVERMSSKICCHGNHWLARPSIVTWTARTRFDVYNTIQNNFIICLQVAKILPHSEHSKSLGRHFNIKNTEAE